MVNTTVNEIREDLNDKMQDGSPHADKLVLSTPTGKDLKITIYENGSEHCYTLSMDDILLRLPWHYNDSENGMRRPTLKVHFNDLISENLMKHVNDLGFAAGKTYSDYLKLVGFPLSSKDVEEIRKDPAAISLQDDNPQDIHQKAKKLLADKMLSDFFEL